MRALVISFTLLACGCNGTNVEVPAEMITEAHAYIEGEFEAPWQLQFGDTWYARNDPNFKMVCGEFVAPKQLDQDMLRYVYYPTPPWGMVEIHDLVLTQSVETRAILDETQATFEQIWANSCEDHRPWRPIFG